jgi:DNA-binding MarR family transcriptional regulator
MARTESESVADKLHSVAIHLLRRLREADVQTGLSPARLSALSVLTFSGPCTLGELASAEQVTAPTMSRLVQSLEKDGLVARSGDDGDRRTVTIRATKRGREVLLRGRALRVARLTDLLSGATAREMHDLESAVTTLERLTQSGA